ncbi:serine/threonine-protein kinase tnni3k-related [Anaeramoeba flamelloides]|uniref:Serine/threonine-protein kinase tnni3k-related n=1 Tax=Anaeramoeba flamelloides TaxID=1746091 RepID=A0ABQ8X8W6_9EUKA|nr:serine/threonine-protein kinase tnni3k-related [Anaeramoeba flamelloides]
MGDKNQIIKSRALGTLEIKEDYFHPYTSYSSSTTSTTNISLTETSAETTEATTETTTETCTSQEKTDSTQYSDQTSEQQLYNNPFLQEREKRSFSSSKNNHNQDYSFTIIEHENQKVYYQTGSNISSEKAKSQNPNINKNKRTNQDEKIKDFGNHLIDLGNLYRFTDKDRIGKGLSGKVYKVMWENTPAVIKIFYDNSKCQFSQEIEVLNKTNHPNLVHLYRIGLDPKFLLMEYCNAGSLFNFLRNEKKKTLLQDWFDRVNILLDISYGLQQLHSSKIIHWDLKSPNILLHIPESNTTKLTHETKKTKTKIIIHKNKINAKICDFGLSRLIKSNHKENDSKDHDRIGTFRWMSPELFGSSNNEIKKPKSCDIYSLGIIMYELITLGKLPFETIKKEEEYIKKILKGKRPKIPSGTPKKLKKLNEKCWAQDPRKRPRITEIVESLESLKQELKLSMNRSDNDNNFNKGGKNNINKSNGIIKINWNIPVQSKKFIGRVEMLKTIRKYFTKNEPLNKKNLFAIIGFGGMGKTRLCLEYVTQNKDKYDQIFWFNGENKNTLLNDYEGVLIANKVIKRNAQKSQNIIQITNILSKYLNKQTANHSNLKRLIIYDNVDNPSEMYQYITKIDGSILVVSRYNYQPYFEHFLCVREFSQKETFQYFEAELDLNKNYSDYWKKIKDILTIHKLVNGYPLTLIQVIHYINQINQSMEIFIEQYKLIKARVFQEKYQLLFETIMLNIYQIQENKLVDTSKYMQLLDLFKYLSFIFPDHIPTELLMNILEIHKKEEFDSLLNILSDYSIVEYQEKQNNYKIHRIIQYVMKEKMNSKEKTQIIRKFVEYYYKNFTFDSNRVDTWAKSTKMTVHILELLKQAKSELSKLYTKELFELYYRISKYLININKNYSLSLYFCERAREIKKKIPNINIDYFRVSLILKDIGYIYYKSSNHEKSIQFSKKSKSYIKKHLTGNEQKLRLLASVLNNIGLAHLSLAQYKESTVCFKKALVKAKDHFKTDNHFYIANIIKNIGLIRIKKCLYNQETVNLFTDSIKILNNFFPNKPNSFITKSYKNLAKLYLSSGIFKKSFHYIKKALDMDYRVYKTHDNPELFIIQDYINEIYLEKEYYEFPLESFEKFFEKYLCKRYNGSNSYSGNNIISGSSSSSSSSSSSCSSSSDSSSSSSISSSSSSSSSSTSSNRIDHNRSNIDSGNVDYQNQDKLLIIINYIKRYYFNNKIQNVKKKKLNSQKGGSIYLDEMENKDHSNLNYVVIIKFLEKSLGKMKKKYEDDEIHFEITRNYKMIGLSYLKMEEYVKAKNYFDRCYKINHQIYNTENHPRVADALHFQGLIYLKKENYKEAFSLFKQSKDIQFKIYDTNNHPKIVKNIFNMGLVYYKQSQPEKAKNCFIQCKKLYTKIYKLNKKHHSISTMDKIIDSMNSQK